MSSIHLHKHKITDEMFELVERKIIQYSYDKVNPGYVQFLLSNEDTHNAFLCFEDEFNLDNCPCILSYIKNYDTSKNELHYYILLLCTKRRFRNMGYASMLLDKFIQTIKCEKQDQDQDVVTKIVLSSVESAVLFYESYGFKWIYADIESYNTLLNFEKFEQEKEYFIMELII